MTARDRTDSSAHEAFAELAAGHALSALEPQDEELFLAHLQGCSACEQAVAEHRQTMGHLAYAAGDAEPPAGGFEAIRAQLRAEAAAEPSAVLSAPASLATARARRAGRTVRLSTALTGVAAALVLVVSLLVVNHGLESSRRSQAVNAAAVDRAVSALLVPGAKQVRLRGHGSAVAVLNGDHLSLVVSGLAANDSRSIYVLWSKSRYGGVRAVGTFDVRSADLTVVNGLRLTGASTLQALMVTREQGRTAPAVTTQTPLVVGSA